MPDRPHEAQLRVEVSKRESRRLGIVMPRSGELERSRRILLRFSCSAIQGKVYGRMIEGRQPKRVRFGSKGMVDGRVKMGIEEARIGSMEVG